MGARRGEGMRERLTRQGIVGDEGLFMWESGRGLTCAAWKPRGVPSRSSLTRCAIGGCDAITIGPMQRLGERRRVVSQTRNCELAVTTTDQVSS